jgi:hypothetical protein
MDSMSIGKVANRVAVGVETLRSKSGKVCLKSLHG